MKTRGETNLPKKLRKFNYNVSNKSDKNYNVPNKSDKNFIRLNQVSANITYK
jgi:hypothetical protein